VSIEHYKHKARKLTSSRKSHTSTVQNNYRETVRVGFPHKSLRNADTLIPVWKSADLKHALGENEFQLCGVNNWPCCFSLEI